MKPKLSGVEAGRRAVWLAAWQAGRQASQKRLTLILLLGLRVPRKASRPWLGPSFVFAARRWQQPCFTLSLHLCKECVKHVRGAGASGGGTGAAERHRLVGLRAAPCLLKGAPAKEARASGEKCGAAKHVGPRKIVGFLRGALRRVRQTKINAHVHFAHKKSG